MSNEYSAVPCNEVKGTATESYDVEGNFTASVDLSVQSVLKDALIADILGNRRTWPNTSFSYKPRAKSITGIVGFSSDTSMTSSQQNYTWDTHVVTVNYSSAEEEDLYSESIEPIVDFIRLDHRFFRWSNGDPLSEGEAPGQLRPWWALKRQVFQASSVPTQLVTNPGYVHSAAFTSPTWGFNLAAETLLLKPEPISRTVTTNGSKGFNWSVNFMYNPNGWNKFYRPSTSSWEEIKTPNGSTWKNYPTANLNALLT